jgi:uncharacterized protein (TIGR02145 family)
MGARSFFLFVLCFFFISCDKRVWENPYDQSSPKALFTPTNLSITQSGTKLILSWNQSNKLISGFKLEREYSANNYAIIANLTKEIQTYTDATVIGGKLYNYRLTAVAGTNYSNTIQASYTTADIPDISQFSLVSKTFLSATYNTIVKDGGSPILKKGVCWSTSPNPTMDNFKTEDGSGSNSYNSLVSNLSPNVKYYIRPYASNAIGIKYGPELILTMIINVIPSQNVTDASGNIYNTVVIGNQTWMAKNLVTTKYQNGQTIPLITNTALWTAASSGAYCDFLNDINSSNAYGHLYNYFAVSDSRNICPVGYHVPSKQEWETLLSYIGGNTSGALLKETGTTYWAIGNGTNLTGFSARSASWRSQDGGFYYSLRTGGAYFWSSTNDTPKNPWVFSINSETTAKISQDFYFETAAGASIRCLKN